jgi:hypothetical protein
LTMIVTEREVLVPAVLCNAKQQARRSVADASMTYHQIVRRIAFQDIWYRNTVHSSIARFVNKDGR